MERMAMARWEKGSGQEAGYKLPDLDVIGRR